MNEVQFITATLHVQNLQNYASADAVKEPRVLIEVTELSSQKTHLPFRKITQKNVNITSSFITLLTT